MLTIYRRADGKLIPAADAAGVLTDGSAVWIDLLQPSAAEEEQIEKAFGIDVPTEAERGMLEQSARFYEDDGALVLTATLVARHGERAQSGGVSFILAKNALITVRTIEPTAFHVGQGRATARIDAASDGADVLMALLESIVERLADVLQETSGRVAKLSSEVFSNPAFGAADLRPALSELGRLGNIITLGRDSLGSLERLFVFAGHKCENHALPGAQLTALTRDAEQLDRVGDALQDHLTFVLDAVLGLVAANQNATLQRLSVAAMVFVPSTLIAGAFGMNFDAMTWYKAPWGPWAAFGAMIVGGLLMFGVARWRKWI